MITGRSMCVSSATARRKINLTGLAGKPELVWAEGMTRAEVRPAPYGLLSNKSRYSGRAGRLSTGELANAEIDALLKLGYSARMTEPRAASARYDPSGSRVIIELTNGCTFSFPPGLAQGLEDATEDQLASVEIIGSGYGLHWEALDADLSVPGLLAGLLGTRAYMARRAGQATSVAKAIAARVNGARGGRPRKAAQD
ncbi:DUF2442 domain-containing protein [Rhodopila sp.]|uniref:DUF2442 domain-containing protein n=1 Tax=Rhodopila sp. TaxID=2480087 RepID=UPI003D13D61E